jgi:hypothetical protein
MIFAKQFPLFLPSFSKYGFPNYIMLALKVLNTSAMTLPYTDNDRKKFVSRFCEYQPCTKWQKATTYVSFIGLVM